MKNIYLAIFLIICFTTALFAQNRSYTGAGNLLAGNTTRTSSMKLKTRRIAKEAQPTNSVTILPLPALSTFPALSFKPAEQQSTVEEKVDVRGAKVGDKVELYVPRNANLPGMKWIAWVTRENEVKIRGTNTTDIAQNFPTQEVFQVRVLRK